MHAQELITSQVLAGTQRFLVRRGLDDDYIQAKFGFDWSLAHDTSAYIDFGAFCDFLEYCARISGNDAFGAELSQSQADASRGLFHYIMMNCPTLKAALHARSKYNGLFSNAYATTLTPYSGGLACEWQLPNRYSSMPQIASYLAGTLLAKTCSALDPGWRPPSVTFVFPKPNELATYQRVFGAGVRFGGDRTRMTFDNASLDRRMEGADESLLIEVETFARRLLGMREAGDSLLDKVRAHLVRQLGRDEAASEASVAAAMNMSRRTFQRRLAENNTSFRALLEETRRSVAAHLISDTHLPFTEIALLLGYSELSSFSRAAKFWFGASPSSMRRRNPPAGSNQD